MSEESASAPVDQNERAIVCEGMVCTRCLNKVIPKFQTKGSTGIEVILWLFALVPGLIYSIWRRTNELRVCPSCESPDLVPYESERAKSIFGADKWEKLISLRKRYNETDDRSWDV